MNSTRILSIFVGLLILVGLLLGPGQQATVGAQTKPLRFLSVTLADLGLEGTNEPQVTWLAVSGEWVAYTLSYVWCGHCHLYARTVYLHNTLTGEVRHVELAQAQPNTNSISAVGGSEFQLAGARLYWSQPAEPLDPIRYIHADRFVPGSFTCERCFYDPATGQGGPAGGAPQADPPSPWQAQFVGSPTPPYIHTLQITRPDLGWRLDVPFPENDIPRMAVVGGDRLAYALNADEPTHPYFNRQLVKYAHLEPPAPAFEQAWARADAPVKGGRVPRGWLWGPRPLFSSYEAYKEGVGDTHRVEYYDKARMEINNPSGNPQDPYFVGNGLLVVEMISGQIQLGNTATLSATAACDIPVAGDPRKDNPLTPGYSDLVGVASLHGDNRAPDRVGTPVDQAIDRHGVVGQAAPAQVGLARYAAYAPQTGHNIPDLFWTVMGEMAGTYGSDWTYVLGYPITEAYWTQMRVQGRDMPVLVQAYQRRVLTYVPDFPPAWRVQQGNVGQHYLEWRYTRQPVSP